MVPTLFFTTFSDGTGAVGRIIVAIDPVKKFEVVGCTMDEAKSYSRQQLQQLTGASQIKNHADELPRSAKAYRFELSPEAKNKLINAGIVIGAGILTRIVSGN